MTRPLRIEFPGAIYHVVSRGDRRESIYWDDADRRFFLRLLADVASRYDWQCHAYCLMGNHYHLLIETLSGELSRGMRHLNGVYTQKFNFRHEQTGHVFQGRYRAELMQKDGHLEEATRYVPLNPVRAKIVAHPRDYKWSSYCATAGYVPKPPWLVTDWTLARFGDERTAAQRAYEAFVLAGINNEVAGITARPLATVHGDDAFRGRVSIEVAKLDARVLSEVPRSERLVGRPELSVLLPLQPALAKPERDLAVRRACLQHGFTLRAVACHLHVHISTVSRIINAAPRS